MSHVDPSPSGSKAGAWIAAVASPLIGGSVSLLVAALVAFGFSEGGDGNAVLFWVLAVVSVLVWGTLGGFIASRLSRGALGPGFGILVSLVVHAGLVAVVLPRT